MRQTLERIMAQYGQPVTLARRDGTKRTLRAYIGPRDGTLAPGDSVEQGVLSLTAREVKALYWQDEVLYHWALLGRRKEAAT